MASESLDGFDDIFAELTRDLSSQRTDPFVNEIHDIARTHERNLATNDTPESRAIAVRDLDERWQAYVGKPIELSGKAFLSSDSEGGFTEYSFSQTEVISRGFQAAMLQGISRSETPVIYHTFVYFEGDNPRPGAMLIEHLEHLALPFPSPEQQLRQFIYHYPDEARHIDELASSSPRADKTLMNYREFAMRIQFGTAIGEQVLADANNYLCQRAQLEPLANYELSIKGTFGVMSNFGQPTLQQLITPKSFTAKIHEVELRPADLSQEVTAGTYDAVPYVRATVFTEHGDMEILLPCSAIHDMRSVRYATF